MTKIKNVALFCLSFRFSKIELKKPSFNILYFLKKHYFVDAQIVYDEYLYPLFYKENEKLTLDNYKNIKITNLSQYYKFSSANDVLKAYKRYLKENALTLDLLMVFHGNIYSAEVCNYYKKLNPNGKIMTIMDYNLNSPKRSKSRKILSNIKHTFFTHTMRNYINNCDVFTVESKAVLDYFKSNKFFTKNIYGKMELFNFGYNAEAYRLKDIVKEKKFITVGRIGTQQKNIELILEALRGMDLGEWKYYFLGPIEDEFNKKIENFYLSNPQLKGKVLFLGGIDDLEQLTDYYAKSKVFVLSSRFESFALVLIEAAYYNNFIISTNVGCATDIIDENKNGMIFSNAEELKKIITKIICDSVDFSKVEEYNQRIRDNYSWDNIVLNSEFFNSVFEKRVQ